jgi:hypothetical protein
MLGIGFDPFTADGQSRFYRFGGSTTMTIAGPGGDPWTDGSHTFRLRNGETGAVLSAATLVVN